MRKRKMTLPDSPRVRPRVQLHFAQSLDGRIGLSGVRTPLSSPAGFALAHRARAENDAVLVGRATVRIDDPRLVADPGLVDGPQPRRIVLASTLDVPSGARVFSGGPGTLVVGVRRRATPEAIDRLRQAGAEVALVAPGDDGCVSLPDALAVIAAWGVRRLLVEGGGRVITSFLRQRLADEATIEIVPRLLGAYGVQAVGAIDVASLSDAVSLEDARLEPAETSYVLRGRLAYGRA
jgi:5-amino-6-(5-phosphoribosylamino)uracil reductase/diaminohydroxyphosphoribosylaminopyrimidine deaminase/5-amino-6-(5-phosphoribosylamino)uracil reductase